MASQQEPEDISQETPPEEVFVAPSIDPSRLLNGQSYAHYTPIPKVIAKDTSTECIMGIDEAGRGPVLGPMVYAAFYLPLPQHHPLLATSHHFNDSKALTPQTRSSLMRTLCTATTPLHTSCGWATKVMSARDISAGMLQAAGSYNLNTQAMDATIELITGVLARGVNVREIYIDTVGPPASYQKKLARIFPTVEITVAKKADALYPCVSAASVVAKVTRDAALEVSYRAYHVDSTAGLRPGDEVPAAVAKAEGWGSGYPGDARCSQWLKRNMDPVFGWGNECRFSWSTAKDLLEDKNLARKVEWPVADEDEEGDTTRVTDYFAVATTSPDDKEQRTEGLETLAWFGTSVSDEVF